MTNNSTGFNLFIDDLREPYFKECVESGVDPKLEWIIARTAQEAIDAVLARGVMPVKLALDHDLGELPDGTIDSVPRFLKWLAYEFRNGSDPIPDYTIHSANPAGVQNMKAFMDSWKKSLILG